MGNIGDTITQTIPTVGSSGTAYATNVDLFLTEVKARLEAKVPRSSLADGILDMNGNPVANTTYYHISNGAGAPTTPTNSLQAYSGNLYWINTGGAVQITSGAALNVASFGGITGDYGGANPAQFKYVSADQEYYAYANFGTGTWAYLWARGIDIAAAATGSNRVRMVYGGAGSYTLTLPPAAPGANAFLQMATTGAVTASNTIDQAVTALEYKFTSTRAMAVAATAAVNPGGGHTLGTQFWTAGNSLNNIVFPIQGLMDGVQINTVSFAYRKLTAATTTWTFSFWKFNHATGTATQIGSNLTDNTANPGYQQKQLTSLTETVGSGYVSYYALVVPSGSNPTGDEVHCIILSVKRP